MENSTKLKILDSISKIYEKSKRCKLEDYFFSDMDTELFLLSSYFGTTKRQSLFVAIVFVNNYKGEPVDYKDLIRHFNCNPLKILEYNEDLTYLCATNIFRKQKSRQKFKLAGANGKFIINEQITEAILSNQSMPDVQEEKLVDVIQVLEKLYNLSQECYEDEITTTDLFFKTRELISKNIDFSLIRNINSFNFEIHDTYLYLFLIWKTLSGKESIDLGRALEYIYDSETKRINHIQSLISGINVLVKYNYIELEESQYFNNCEIKLTENSINLLAECGINFFKQKKQKKKFENILSPTDIPFRELIFCQSEMQQLFTLKDLLSDTKFKETQKRLSSKSLSPGVTVLLHGVAGTGKTEIARQLAKETNRELMKVDISQSKSKWFGESQKLIKQIFTDYKVFTQDCKRTPILLINEADAILSKRKSIESSNTAQTENNMQNILLEEIENFEGILVATTNLADYLDSAFERRFLFKIQFNKPDIFIRARIWKSKMPLLEMEDCKVLAEKFAFSGGQIDNIIRKKEIYEIINGVVLTMDNLMTFCAEETLTKQMAKVGFSKV